jgi:hypothetical protein
MLNLFTAIVCWLFAAAFAFLGYNLLDVLSRDDDFSVIQCAGIAVFLVFLIAGLITGGVRLAAISTL